MRIPVPNTFQRIVLLVTAVAIFWLQCLGIEDEGLNGIDWIVGLLVSVFLLMFALRGLGLSVRKAPVSKNMEVDTISISQIEARTSSLLAELLNLSRSENLRAWSGELYGRTRRAAELLYELVEDEKKALWTMPGVYQQDLKILYERLSYGLAIIGKEYEEFYRKSPAKTNADTQRFVRTISSSLDMAFKDIVTHSGIRVPKELPESGVVDYFNADMLSDEFMTFLTEQEQLVNDAEQVRSKTSESFVCGALESDSDDDFFGANMDCFHLWRISKIVNGLDVKTFLKDTKEDYLPAVIAAFVMPSLSQNA